MILTYSIRKYDTNLKIELQYKSHLNYPILEIFCSVHSAGIYVRSSSLIMWK